MNENYFDEINFERYLRDNQKIKSEGAISSRMSRARRISKILRMSLDRVVEFDENMPNALDNIANYDTSGNLKNALRHYYKFKNGREYPKRKYE
jgi:hypothetical protein